MKTAISIPDNIFESVEELAERLGKSRSQLYTQALRNYLENHLADNVTKKLNEIYVAEDSSLESGLQNLQALSLPKDRW